MLLASSTWVRVASFLPFRKSFSGMDGWIYEVAKAFRVSNDIRN